MGVAFTERKGWEEVSYKGWGYFCLSVCLLVSLKGCRGYAESPDGWNKRSQDRLHIRSSHHVDTVTAPCSSNEDLEQMAPGGLTFLVFVYSSGGCRDKRESLRTPWIITCKDLTLSLKFPLALGMVQYLQGLRKPGAQQ